MPTISTILALSQYFIVFLKHLKCIQKRAKCEELISCCRVNRVFVWKSCLAIACRELTDSETPSATRMIMLSRFCFRNFVIGCPEVRVTRRKPVSHRTTEAQNWIATRLTMAKLKRAKRQADFTAREQNTRGSQGRYQGGCNGDAHQGQTQAERNGCIGTCHTACQRNHQVQKIGGGSRHDLAGNGYVVSVQGCTIFSYGTHY